MLIAEEIKRLYAEKRLFFADPLDWRMERKRFIYVSASLNAFLSTEPLSAKAKAERRRLQALFRKFISGDTISIGFNQNIKATELKRLSPKGAEVWEFKRRDFRVFCRFACVDTVIALTGPIDKVGLDYDFEKTRCQQEWQNILNGHSPIYGSKLSDYISGTNVIALGNP